MPNTSLIDATATLSVLFLTLHCAWSVYSSSKYLQQSASSIWHCQFAPRTFKTLLFLFDKLFNWQQRQTAIAGVSAAFHWLRSVQCTHIRIQPFYGPFSRTTRVSRCQKKSSSGLYGAMENNRGRHTDHPAGRHSIQTNQRPTSVIPPFLCRIPFLPQPSHFILAWDGHQICWLACPVGRLGLYSALQIICLTLT